MLVQQNYWILNYTRIYSKIAQLRKKFHKITKSL